MRGLPLRLAWAEIRGNRAQSFLILTALTLGMLGLFFILSFGSAVQSSTREQAQAILGADLDIRSRQPLNADQEQRVRAELPPGSRLEKTNSLYSMLTHGEISRLSQIESWGQNYPYYGWVRVRLDSGEPQTLTAPFSERLLADPKGVWIAEDLAIQLALGLGDPLRIGSAEFSVRGIVVDSSFNSWKGFSFAPSAYLSAEGMVRTGLITSQSLVFHDWVIELPGAPSSASVQNLKRKLQEGIQDSSVRVITREDSSEQTTITVRYLNDFLSLVSLCGLLLAILGSSFLFRASVLRKESEWKTLHVLGLSPERVVRIFSIQLLLFSLAAALVASALSQSLLPFATRFLQSIFGVKILPSWNPALSLGTVGLCVLFVHAFHVPLLTRIAGRAPRFWHWLPFVGLFIGASILLSNSFRNGLIFAVTLAGTVGLLYGLFYLLLLLSDRVRGRVAPHRSLAMFLTLSRRNQAQSFSLLVSLGIGAVLLTLAPQVEQNLRQQLELDDQRTIPSLFLFDIQEDQAPQIGGWAESQGFQIRNLTPMIRARLIEKNGEPLQDLPEKWVTSREDEEEERTRNRTYNLTFRSHLLPSERLIDGTFPTNAADPDAQEVEVSLERRFAERLRLSLGDQLTFDILGERLVTRVTSLRAVRWTSFEPGFFLVLQPNALLDEAPKTWLASAGPFPRERKLQFQEKLVRAFPNISAIDVDEISRKLLGVVGLIRQALQLMGVLALLTGFFVFVSMQLYLFELRKREWMLLEVLTGDRKFSEGLLAWEVIGVAGLSGFLGIAISTGLSRLLTQQLFEADAVTSWALLTGAWALILLSSAGLYLAFSRRLSQLNPRELLQDERT